MTSCWLRADTRFARSIRLRRPIRSRFIGIAARRNAHLGATEMPQPETQPEPQEHESGPPVAVGVADPLLSTDKLVKEYRQRRVVNGVSIKVSEGEIVGLLGPNGAGKTTTFNMVVGLIKPDGGAVRFQGRPITRLAM